MVLRNLRRAVNGLLAAEEAIGDFVAGGGPQGALPDAVRGAAQRSCDSFANVPGWAIGIGNASLGPMSRMCAPYYANQGFDGPTIAPPFTGGQCGTIYDYTGTISKRIFDSFNGNYFDQDTNFAGAIPGPARLERTNTGQSIILNVVSPAGSNFIGSYPTILGQNGSVSINFVRRDGMPDNCGDPPPILITPPGGVIPPPLDDPNFVPPRFPPGGGYPSIDFPDFYLDPDLNVEVPVPPDLSGPDHDPNNPGGDRPDNDGNNPPPADTDTPDDEPDEDSRPFYGLIVYVTEENDDTATEVLQTPAPLLFVPRLGNVYFLMNFENGYAWTADIPIKNRRQFIPTPGGFPAISFTASLKPGVVASFSRVYANNQQGN